MTRFAQATLAAKEGNAAKVAVVRCREIMPDDRERIIDLLARGFGQAPREHWSRVLSVLAAHHTPEGYPKYGYLLENDGVAVGVLLMIFTARVDNGVTQVQCCESSYYVDPPFRFYAPLLVKSSHRFNQVTYLNVSAARHTWTVLDTQGYKRIAGSVYCAVPVLCPVDIGQRVRRVGVTFSDQRLDCAENRLLRQHAGYKCCISVICERDGVIFPFVFVLRRKYGIGFAFLIYCHSQADIVTFAGALGRFLARRLVLLVIIDASESIAGVPGMLLAKYPKYWKGEKAPRVGDLAYTELAMFQSGRSSSVVTCLLRLAPRSLRRLVLDRKWWLWR